MNRGGNLLLSQPQRTTALAVGEWSSGAGFRPSGKPSGLTVSERDHGLARGAPFFAGALFVFFFYFSGLVLADTTIGTNISTTGTLTVKSDSASAILFQNAAGSTSIFKFDNSNKRLGLDAYGGTLDTTLEVGGTASISGVVTLANGQIRPSANSTTAFRFQNAAGMTDVLAIDTTNTRVGVGTSALTEALEIVGNASISGDIRINGSDVLDSAGTSRINLANTGYVDLDTDLEVSGNDIQDSASTVRVTFQTGGTLFTGTASVSGSFEVGTSDLFVNTTGMGVNTNNLSEALEVVGLASISGDIRVNGDDIQDSGGTARITFGTTPNVLLTGTASTSTHFEVAGSAAFSGGVRGSGLTDCDTAATSKLLWDITTGKFSCGTDETGGVKTEEGGTQNLAAATILNFDGGKFTLTASGTTESVFNLDWGAGGPASLSQDETVSGLWTFSGGVSVSTNFELTGNTRLGVNAGGVTNTSLEIGGTASISGIITLADGQLRPGVNAVNTFRFQNAAGSTDVLTIDTTNTRFGVGNIGGTLNTTLEVSGTASISGVITLADGQIRPSANGTTSFRFQNAAGTTDVLTFDTTNTRVGVGSVGTLQTTLEVGGTASASSLIIGSGDSITRHLSSTFSINFATLTQKCLDSAGQTVTGAALGDTILVSANVALPASFSLQGFVSAADTVVFRWCEFGTPLSDPDGGGATYRADVWKH